MSDPEEAIESVLLGESLAQLFQRVQMETLRARDREDFDQKLASLDRGAREDLKERCARFVGNICRLLGERHEGEDRIARVLLAWTRISKDYDAFDALLCHFDFPKRPQVLEEAKLLFPSTLTAHWDD